MRAFGFQSIHRLRAAGRGVGVLIPTPSDLLHTDWAGAHRTVPIHREVPVLPRGSPKTGQ